MNEISADERRVALREASEWLMRLQDESVSDEELESWGRWMAASPKHAAAFDHLSALWDASSSLDSAAILRAREHRTSTRPVDVSAASKRSSRRWLAGVAALAAGIAAVVVGFFVLNHAPADSEIVYATAIGERRHLTLADGSTIDLDAATEATVRYTKDRRYIELQRGQAYFEVAHAPDRPFLVTAGGVQSQALGTRFAVSHRADRSLVVTVVEGRVRVSAVPAQAGGTSQVDAASNQQVTFIPTIGLSPSREVNAALSTVWREGTVVYRGELLENVIADLNRYSRIRVRLQDPRLGNQKVTGRWTLADTESWLNGLAGALRMRITRDAGGIVLSQDELQKNATAGSAAVPVGGLD